MEKRTSLGVAAAAVLACGSAHADILNYRDWLTANPTTPNSTANEWYGTIGLGGPMMATDGSYWYSPGYPALTPLLGLRTTVGSDNGAAGPATFDGSWVHPGSGVPAVLVFAPTIATAVGGMDIRSELIANGLSGNGITITVYATIGGNTSTLGTTTLASISTSVLDSFNLPNVTTLNPGDSLSVAFGDNGSYLFDHMNFNAWITVPTPGATALLAIGALAAARRRR
ncbi:MAG TPA: hypothetical protein VK157_06490 [Phycisphaerales bacterium]|nr:hypothetical protein [Phycisphaerales bacterium]